MIPTTVERVPLHTSEAANEGIRRETEQNIRRLQHAGPPVRSKSFEMSLGVLF